MTRKSILYIVLILCTTTITLYGIHTIFVNTCGGSTHTEERWVECIQSNGAEVAYEYFKKENLDAEFSKKHVNAHVFSGALYTTTGINGIAICDGAYRGGCFHEILSRVFLSGGHESLIELANICKQLQPGEYNKNCLHGFGHGLIALEGYKYTDLYKVLDFCYQHFPYTTEPGNDDFGSECYLGAFMEYNERNFIQSEFTEPRELNTDSIYEPCDIISDEYKNACYFKLTRLWSLQTPDIELITKHQQMTALCENIPEEGYRYPCISGVILSISLIDMMSRDEQASLCNGVFEKPEDRSLCRGIIDYRAERDF